SVYLVMDLLEGQTVEARAHRAGRLPMGEVAWIADQVLDVLHAAHTAGIVHRDIKPDNLFVTNRGAGQGPGLRLARLLAEAPGAPRAAGRGSPMGTPAFRPPEQALGKKAAIDARTDLWALAASMFELITGRTVHVGETVNQLLLAAMTKPAEPIREVA